MQKNYGEQGNHIRVDKPIRAKKKAGMEISKPVYKTPVGKIRN